MQKNGLPGQMLNYRRSPERSQRESVAGKIYVTVTIRNWYNIPDVAILFRCRRGYD